MLRDCFLSHREMGQSEVLYRVLPFMHLKHSSLGEIFINTGREKSKFLKKLTEEEAQMAPNVIRVADDDGLYVETSSILDKYYKRPYELSFISPIQFAKRYTTARAFKSNKLDEDEEVDSEDEGEEDKKDNIKDEGIKELDFKTFPTGIDNTIENDFIIHLERGSRHPLPKQIALNGPFYPGEPRFMRLRKPLVVRYHKFKRSTEPHDFLFSELELYHGFETNEIRNKCKEDFEFCYETYSTHIENINYVRSKTMPFVNHVQEGLEIAEELFHKDNIANVLDPQAAQDDADCEEEGNEDVDEFVAFDYDKLEDAYAQQPDKMFKKVVLEDLEKLSKKTLELDDDQLFVVEMIIDYVKLYKRAIRTKTILPEPPLLKVLGKAGSGKSYLIDIICQWISRDGFLRTEGDNPEHPYFVKSAFTGAAACNIGKQEVLLNFILILVSFQVGTLYITPLHCSLARALQVLVTRSEM